MIKENKKQYNYFLLGVFLLYLAFNALLLWRHEMWRDEINVWLMGQDLSVWELFREIKYQGHPCLWYLVIMPFAKLGFPCRIMGIISFLIMSCAAGIYLWKAPINGVVKAVSLFSPIFTYYYTEIARGYCLVAFIIILLALFYRNRNERPLLYGILLGLLVQADTIALPIAGMISFMWLVENGWHSIRKKERKLILTAAKGLWIPLASLCLWIFQFYHVSDSPVFQVNDLGLSEFVGTVIRYCYWILERLTGWNRTTCTIAFILMMVAGFGMGILRKNIWPLLVFGATILFQGVFSCLVYELNIWHFISLCFVYVWMLWVFRMKQGENSLRWEDRFPCVAYVEKALYILAEIILLVVSVFMFMRWNAPGETSSMDNALYGSYSDGVYAAEFIVNNLSEDEVLVISDVAYASTIWGFAKEYRAFYAGSGKETSYADWSEEQTQDISFDELVHWVKDTFPEKDSFVLVQCASSCVSGFNEHLDQCEVLYKTEVPSARQEDYIIYRVYCE